MSADLPEGLRLAVEAVARNNPPPLTVADYPIAMAALAECLDEVDKQRQREAAEEAAQA